jgi:5-amino-6-(5-phospho-D-ribitylamino)uracil phosphatase
MTRSDTTQSGPRTAETTLRRPRAAHDPGDRWLIALDIDGTVLLEDGEIRDSVIEQVRRVRDLGHEVMLATGRAASMTLPILERLGIAPQYLVCSNGSLTLGRNPDAPTGYEHAHVETFDPSDVLTTISAALADASFAVEDESGFFRYTGHFPNSSLGGASQLVEFDELMHQAATRVVVISPEHAVEEFLTIVEQMGLHKVSYNVGWTAWLDIAPEGVNKATALERVREWLGIPRSRVMAVGDGRNDIDMLRWAAEAGRGVAMGQAPEEVAAVASEHTGTDLEDGVASLLRGI